MRITENEYKHKNQSNKPARHFLQSSLINQIDNNRRGILFELAIAKPMFDRVRVP
jgi:hypothetical protein